MATLWDVEYRQRKHVAKARLDRASSTSRVLVRGVHKKDMSRSISTRSRMHQSKAQRRSPRLPRTLFTLLQFVLAFGARPYPFDPYSPPFQASGNGKQRAGRRVCSVCKSVGYGYSDTKAKVAVGRAVVDDGVEDLLWLCYI
ncbi:hypothetical protein BD410DRAFT_782786 [Rickenella mellea]|uniref:Uncharacterized protein n=1 Tax=Rickenella mellea TaxID=50990 RepID=A0A4Y7QJ29_9AGAM|nr:hypothetical protein BD410DRAFT_782786 [Rickenella mellea]